MYGNEQDELMDQIADYGATKFMYVDVDGFVGYLKRYMEVNPVRLAVIVGGVDRTPRKLYIENVVDEVEELGACSSTPEYMMADIKRAEDNQKMVMVNKDQIKQDGSCRYTVHINWDDVPF